MSHNRGDLGKMLKMRRLMIPLTLKELSNASGVSISHLGRIEHGQRFPSAHILRKIAKPLGIEETELFYQADYLSPVAESKNGTITMALDSYVARVLAEEPIEVQRIVIGILGILKSIANGSGNIGFPEYIHKNYPEVDEDVIIMIQDILEHRHKIDIV